MIYDYKPEQNVVRWISVVDHIDNFMFTFKISSKAFSSSSWPSSAGGTCSLVTGGKMYLFRNISSE